MGAGSSTPEMVGGEHTAQFLGRLLEVVEKNVVPLTEAGVQAGNKVFGAAVLRKDDTSLVVAATNKEMEWPLLHGEMSCLRDLQALPAAAKPKDNKECIFLSTHEPCSLCLSGITWSGFDNFYYLFSYENTKDAFNIPHDLKILEEVFACDGGAYRRENDFWKSYSVEGLIGELPAGEAKDALKGRVAALRTKYAQMSDVYQGSKASNNIPLN